MNAERLHVIVRAIRDEMKSSDTVTRLKNISENLLAQVNDPHNPDYQQVISDNLKSLYGALEEGDSNEFNPAWKQSAIEIGAYDLLGDRLQSRLQKIFERNQITPAIANDEVAELLKQVQDLNTAIVRVSRGFERLNIGAEELKPGECELGVLVPRGYVKNSLDFFGKELRELDFIFKTFTEVVTGSRPNLNIRTISSSDLTIFLDIAPEVAAFMAVAVERVIATYKKILEIRKLRGELKKQDVPENKLGGIEDHANDLMSDSIEELVVELMDKSFKSLDAGRSNELKNALRFALQKIANRIDNGFNIDIRVEPIPENNKKTEGESTQSNERDVHVKIIQDASKSLQFINPEGSPILRLPESEEKQEE